MSNNKYVETIKTIDHKRDFLRINVFNVMNGGRGNYYNDEILTDVSISDDYIGLGDISIMGENFKYLEEIISIAKEYKENGKERAIKLALKLGYVE